MEPLLLAFSRLGLRIMEIGYNYRSFAADGCFSPSNAGLSDNGPELIRLMEKYGITVDLSHIGERSALEASELAQKPQIYSHSNPRALFDHPRNISDEQAKKCAATGGVIGVSGYNVTLWDGKRFPNIDSFVDCIAYYCDLLGPEHVGVGMDTTATEGCYPRDEILYFNRLVRQVSGKNAVAYQSFLQGRPAPLGNCVEGLMCLANWVRLVDRMLQRGFSAEEIRQIGGENWLRVFRATWPH
ncbi:hypothetical protein SDC9_127696 [bioreactor metagenome]|uniref:Membrane dipeptidase n=1 Tax=bioreactor metagenome TaxID=1076179 RepID=A0A645CU52_9ZZZZ